MLFCFAFLLLFQSVNDQKSKFQLKVCTMLYKKTIIYIYLVIFNGKRVTKIT